MTLFRRDHLEFDSARMIAGVQDSVLSTHKILRSGIKDVVDVLPFWQVGSLTVLSFALAEEVSQYFIPSRTLDIVDAACDVLGIGAFTAGSVMLMRFRKSVAESSSAS